MDSALSIIAAILIQEANERGMAMCDIWKEQRSKPVCLLAMGLGVRGQQAAEEGKRQLPAVPFCMLQDGEPQITALLQSVDVLYLAAGVEESATVAQIGKQAKKMGVLVLWSPGKLEKVRFLPLPGSVLLQSGLSIAEELYALTELFGTVDITATLNRQKLLERLRGSLRVNMVLAEASGRTKSENIAHQLADQGWRMPDDGTLVMNIGASVDCRLEEMVELWSKMVKQTTCSDVLWGASFHTDKTDTLRLILLAVGP